MRAIIGTILICYLVAVLAGPGWAIDKSKKTDPPAKKTTVDKEKKKDQPPAQGTDSQKPVPAKPKKSYDDFLDRNNNGIDDRAEKGANPKKTKKVKTSGKPAPKIPKP